MANELAPNEPRLGYFYDGDDATPTTAAQLVRTDDEGAVLSVAWEDRSDAGRIFERWFSGSTVMWGDDPERTEYKYDVPRLLDFADAHGRVALIGCHRGPSTSGGSAGLGVGHIRVDYAVMGARNSADYEEINGMRSEIAGLGDWVGLTSIEQTRHTEGNRLKRAVFTLESPESIPVPGVEGLSLRPSFQYGDGAVPDQTILTDRIYVETLYSDPAPWEQHLTIHGAIRELIAVAAWSPRHFLSHRVQRDGDGLRTLDGEEHGPEWREVITNRTRVAAKAQPDRRRRPLFTFATIGADGVATWLHLRETKKRGIGPIVALLNAESTLIETGMAQMGIGLEGLGYSLAVDAGFSKGKSDGLTLKQRLSHIIADCKIDLPFSGEDWVERTARIYNAVKHADRAVEDPLDILNCYRECSIVFRAWLAGRLGADPVTVRQSLQYDPSMTPYRWE